MKIKINFRTWFSDHLVAVSCIFALAYQLFDIFLNYFVSGELKQGFSNFYQSPGGEEDLTRFLVMLLLFICFGAGSRSIVRENVKAAEDQSHHLNEIKNFANAVVHDVKNPAIGIYTMGMLLKKKYGEMIDDQGKHYLEIMEQTAKDIVAQMESVNVFIRAREYPLTFETVNIQHEIEIIHETINPTLAVRHIEWFQRPETFPQIRGDRLSIHRIFRNLIDNALKYGGDNLSQLTLEYSGNDRFHAFWLCDNGCGIDDSEQEDIFEIFGRAKTSGSVEGFGLGLSIVKELVEKHNGSIQVNSMSGNGSTFMFTISKNL